MTNTKYLIFDFDGVLADSFQAIAEHELTRFPDLTIPQIKEKMIIHAQADSVLDQIADREKIELRKQRVLTMANAIIKKEILLFSEFLHQIHKLENTKLAIVTNNSNLVAKHLLGKIEHDFEYILGTEDDYLKSDKIKFICQKWGVDINDIIYFTDTQNDVHHLQNYMDKSKIYGCSWGWHGYERLAQVLPKENILVDFGDINKIFKTHK